MDQNALTSLGVACEWVWGNQARTAVFAQAYGMGRTMIFRFTGVAVPTSLGSQIVNCFFDKDVTRQETLADTATLRNLLWSAIALMWRDCVGHPLANEPDTIVYFINSTWTVDSEPLYHRKYLRELSNFTGPSPDQTKRIPFTCLARLQQLGGRGCATLVHIRGQPEQKWVFKGVDFRVFLFTHESGTFPEEVDGFENSVSLLSRMPRHPNILAPPRMLTTLHFLDSECVCGALYPFYRNGSLADFITKQQGIRIPLLKKAHWCRQMASALAHTHNKANTFHMDVQPSNFLLDSNSNLVLIDWEQNNATVMTAAPEIDGTWDAEETQQRGANGIIFTTIEYTKYTGPRRCNMREPPLGNKGWNVWNSFLVWQKESPLASELAEVFSLGRTMWMLLTQCDAKPFSNVESTLDIMEDWSTSNDIPESWKNLVDRCLECDPTSRPVFNVVEAFWEGQIHQLTETGYA